MTSKRTKPELYEEIRQLKKELKRAKAAAAKNNVFVPHELKTIEVDTEKKIFKVNGEDFGEGCTEFSITCTGPGEFNIRMEIGTTVRYVHYEGPGSCQIGRVFRTVNGRIIYREAATSFTRFLDGFNTHILAQHQSNKTDGKHPQKGGDLMDLKNVKTCDLVLELQRREGVECMTAEPYEDVSVTVNGPAAVLVVTD